MRYPNTEKRVEDTTCNGVFDTIQGGWIADDTMSISCQSKQKLKSKQTRKIIKTYAN